MKTERTREATKTPGIRKVTTRAPGKQPSVKYEARIATSDGREVTKSFARIEDARTFRSEALHQRNKETLSDSKLQKVTFSNWVNGAQWQKHLATLRPKTVLIYTEQSIEQLTNLARHLCRRSQGRRSKRSATTP